ncbi:Dihydrolipoamide acetyltransferase [Perilla frutescens var. frutescens]|nr:Dihydrolipoamide acetyltransferase [Perilla frutescens var. frutescens]
MALSRLRHLVISRAPCLMRDRFLSLSSAHSSLYRSRGLNSKPDVVESLLRPASCPLFNGIYGDSSTIKFIIGIRSFSSAEIPEHTVLQMPTLSPTMNQGNIAKWRKQKRDKIEVGDVICEIETDKATLEFQSAVITVLQIHENLSDRLSSVVAEPQRSLETNRLAPSDRWGQSRAGYQSSTT